MKSHQGVVSNQHEPWEDEEVTVPFLPQARDAWGNNLWGSDFNVTAALYVADTSAEEGGFGSHQTTIASNETDNGNWDRVWDGAEEEAAPSVVSLFGNGSGIALVSYFPRDAGTSFLYGEKEEKGTFRTQKQSDRLMLPWVVV